MSSYKINIENANPEIITKKKNLNKLAEIVLTEEGVLQAEINIILVDDSFITKLNQEYLNTNNTTDVISFNLDDDGDKLLEGEVYANTDQIRRQAEEYEVTFQNELYRIVIHGVLHLIGFKDQTPLEKNMMSEKENHYLTIFENVT